MRPWRRLAPVNTNAVSQMDQVTRQNVALVEESATAAESLKAQAAELVQIVAVFKLAEQEPVHHEVDDDEHEVSPHVP